MKLRYLIPLLVVTLFAACTSFHNGAPPTKVEEGLFSIVTNYVPVIVYTTNTVAGQPPVVTTQTNQEPHYTYTPGPGVGAVRDAAALVPGYGGLIGTGVGALAALWAWFRSSKQGKTAATLGQSVETLREFIKTLPNGTNYDSALTAWLQQHQVETGTVNDVLSLLEKEVDNKDAVVAAQQIRATIAALNPSALPPKPPGT